MWLLSPLSWLLLSGLGACIAARRRSSRWLRLLLAAAVLSTIAMTPMFANLLLGWLERPQPVPPHCVASPPQVAVVLAGGVDRVSNDERDMSVLGAASRRRLESAVDWWRERPGRVIVVSGGPAWRGGTPESRWMIRHAQRLGVPAADLRGEETSSNTWENAQEVAAIAPALPRRVVLISSAMHLPRARYAMERAGFDVCPIATDWRRTPFGLPGYLIPQSSALLKTEAALHELVGMAYYRWLASRDGRNRHD
ncbi:uncharacterized SAM-binding protein YcdF (DUF218 family) [Lysobacter niastensis]|uniref:Uncharacterized SAM-binding protein YcdF (DUF218 family) n=1 Tax=Lysobacter niastensis TaxID=380629 RepID=A0ABU1W9P2_9GAMM|nr:YdcF family protein [Lysobacter niastensis]MDR7134177.1 uncharacterized SAM-binding protein YcdF (DUF218 family) [Lysobacter niastensis]